MAEDGRAYIKVCDSEFTKKYYVYDVSDRVTEIYEAPVNAANGAPCMKTTIGYWTTTTKVKLVVHSASTWNTAWEA